MIKKIWADQAWTGTLPPMLGQNSRSTSTFCVLASKLLHGAEKIHIWTDSSIFKSMPQTLKKKKKLPSSPSVVQVTFFPTVPDDYCKSSSRSAGSHSPHRPSPRNRSLVHLPGSKSAPSEPVLLCFLACKYGRPLCAPLKGKSLPNHPFKHSFLQRVRLFCTFNLFAP